MPTTDGAGGVDFLVFSAAAGTFTLRVPLEPVVVRSPVAYIG